MILFVYPRLFIMSRVPFHSLHIESLMTLVSVCRDGALKGGEFGLDEGLRVGYP